MQKVIFSQYIPFFPQRVLTINEPVVYMVQNVMNLMGENPMLRAIRRGEP
jgi:hypothetical protein